jgi:hypothetical protein
MGIIENMYGGGGGGKPVKTDYYGSFGYFNDLANGVGPPPADKGGPTNMQLAINEGYADETGMLSNGMHSIVSAMYGGAIAPQTGGQSLNPDYQAGFNGKTVGGIGDTDAWGNPMNWSNPQTKNLKEGDVFEAGDLGSYKVATNPWGQYVLEPIDGAMPFTGPYGTNMTHGLNHLGINPETGDVWFQEAAGAVNFGGGGKSYMVNPNGPGYTPPNNGGNNGDNNSGRTWQDVATQGVNGGTDSYVGKFDPYLGMNMGSAPIQWDSLIGENGDLTRLNQEFEKLVNSGIFGEDPDSYYTLLLRNLGLLPNA